MSVDDGRLKHSEAYARCITDRDQLRADLEAARAEIGRLKASGFGATTTGCGAPPATVTVNNNIWMNLQTQLAQSRATEAELRARIVRHHDTTVMAKLQSGVRCPACTLNAQEPRT